MSTLPLKAMSRLWGRFNELEIPYYLRVPGFKLYSFIFGVKSVEYPIALHELPTNYIQVFPKYQNLIFMYIQISHLFSIELSNLEPGLLIQTRMHSSHLLTAVSFNLVPLKAER